MRETKRILMHFRKKRKKAHYISVCISRRRENPWTRPEAGEKKSPWVLPFSLLHRTCRRLGGRATQFAKRRRRRKKKIFAHGDTTQNFRVSAWTLTPLPCVTFGASRGPKNERVVVVVVVVCFFDRVQNKPQINSYFPFIPLVFVQKSVLVFGIGWKGHDERGKEGRKATGNTPIFLLLLLLFRTWVKVEEEEMTV